jgi:YegS/Rv2252/BmrU family lipid kinase
MSKKKKLDRVKLIVNSGAGKVRENPACLEEVTRCLMDLGLRVDVALAHPKRNAIPIVKRAVKKGYSTVIAMGGDGTIGAVIEGLVGSKVHLGIIPAGTANDIAASLGIPMDLKEACKVIANAQARPMDLGMLTTSERKDFPFFMVAAVGLVATIYPKLKNVPEGKLAGIKEAVGVFMGAEKDPKVFLTLDDESKIEVETPMVLIANTPLIGLRNLVAPAASMEDGLIDIAVFPDFSKAEALAYFARTMGEASTSDGKVQRYQARKIKIKTDPEQDIAAEGMVMGKGKAKIKVLPGALYVIAPEATGQPAWQQEPAPEAKGQPAEQQESPAAEAVKEEANPQPRDTAS